jgi:hypothetical protein
MDYAEYIETFNSGDHAALLEHCTDDIIFESGKLQQVCQGKDEFIEFLQGILQDDIRQIIRAQVVLQNKDYVFAETDIDFHALRDVPDFAFGALKEGEYLTTKTFVVYYLRDGKVCRIKTSMWPANFAVTDPPTIGFGPEPPISGGIRANV